MSITYGSPSWNVDSTKIDSAYLILRDKTSGRIVQINLEETEPDSSKFMGHFSVNLGESDKIMPEVFVPPSDIRKGDKDNRKLYELIQNNKLPRKPVIFTKNERGQGNLDVYDTREQAEAALKAYQAEVALAKPSPHNGAKPLASEKASLMAKQMERQMELNRLAAEAAKRESERVRLEQIERQKAEERLRQAKAATEKERAERKARAQAVADEAMALFNQGKFAESEAKFKMAVELDPENKSYYFKYGVALYRLEKYNEALVILNLADVDPHIQNEKNYFMGLTHYRLKELPAALSRFSSVAATSDPVMAPSSEFYKGVILFVQEKYEPAKAAFEKVIDTSKDPALDQQAEDYIENIAAAQALAKLRENKFTFTGTVGAMYDSNVLLAPDNESSQGSTTNIADFRLLTIGDLEYRPVLTDKQELFVKLNASLINSAQDKAAAADPYVYNLSLPYSYKGFWGQKAMKTTIKPGYETLFMAEGGSSTKGMVFNSYFIAAESTLIMNPKWFANYSLEYRRDDSRMSSSNGPEDADANKYSLKTNQTFFLDKARKRAVIGSAGYVLNSAAGDNKKYNRYEGGATYVRPIKWNATWSLGLSVYKLTYPDESNNRRDFNLSLSSGVSKPIKENLIWGLNASYTKNDSNVNEQEYSKYTIFSTLTYIANF